MKFNWIFVLGILTWGIITATLFELSTFSTFKSFISQAITHPNPITASLAFIVLGVIFVYILKGIELGKKEIN